MLHAAVPIDPDGKRGAPVYGRLTPLGGSIGVSAGAIFTGEVDAQFTLDQRAAWNDDWGSAWSFEVDGRVYNVAEAVRNARPVATPGFLTLRRQD